VSCFLPTVPNLPHSHTSDFKHTAHLFLTSPIIIGHSFCIQAFIYQNFSVYVLNRFNSLLLIDVELFAALSFVFTHTTAGLSVITNFIETATVLGAFHKLWKATISFLTSVCPSSHLCEWNDSAPTRQISTKFDIWVFLKKIRRKN